MRYLGWLLLLACVGGCTRDWPVPLGAPHRGRVTVVARGDRDACRLHLDVLERAADVRRLLGPTFAVTVEERLGLSGGAAAPAAEAVEAAVGAVAWGRERGLLLLAGPCEPGLRLERVVEPGRGAWRWEAQLWVDPGPAPEPGVSWLLVGAAAGQGPPLGGPAGSRWRELTPGGERVRVALEPEAATTPADPR